MATQGRDAAIVGVYEYPSRDVEGKFNPLQIKAASAAKALADAGLTFTTDSRRAFAFSTILASSNDALPIPAAITPFLSTL